MRFSALSAALTAASVAALSVPKRDAQTLYTLKLSPTETKEVTEEEKWALKAQGTNFIDITNHPSLASEFTSDAITSVTYPSSITHQSAVKPLLSALSTANLQANLVPFTQFQNRYFNSTYGAQSSAWLLQQARSLLSAAGATNATATPFPHAFLQSSIIVTLPGASDKTIVLGAHQDSVNARDPDRKTNRAPGADDDGSGAITLLEALRGLLADADVRAGRAPNSIEFHWYAGEEGGLLGSADVWAKYKAEGRNVKAMLQQDMTGYTKGMKDKGKVEVVGVITDYVDASLTAYIKKVIDAYCDISYVETKCGYACSDHSSASENGYPSAFVFESAFEDHSPYIHTKNDTLETVDYDHMLQHTKMTVGLAYELAFAADL